MAERKATLILELKDMATQQLNKFNGWVKDGVKTLGDFKYALASVTAAGAGVVVFLNKALNAYMENENAVNKLNTALKNQGVYSAAASRDLQEFASQLQRQTTFTDEAIIETQALLTTFGMSGEAMKKATKNALDLSVAYKIDLHSATVAMGKASQGNTMALEKLVGKIDENIPKSERLAAIQLRLASSTGAAAAEVNTTAGRMKNMSNQVGELYEKIGRLLAPVVSYFVSKLLILVDALNQVGDSSAKMQRMLASVFMVFLESMKAIPIWGKVFNDQIDTAIGKLDQWASAAERDAQRQIEAEAGKTEAMRNETLARQAFLDEEAQAVSDKAKEKREKEIASEIDDLVRSTNERKRVLDAFDAERTAAGKGMTAFEKKQNADRAQNLASTLTYIANLSTAHNKALAAVGKAGAIAMAIINTNQAATLAMSSAPPPWNMVLRAMVYAAGMAHVAAISGVQLAEGGVVMPRTGGTLATIGEAGSAEAVIPLDDARAQEKMGMLGGVTINVGTLVADDRGVKELAKRIDEALYKLGRTGERVS